MFYLSIAIMFMVTVFAFRPPSITIRKVIVVENPIQPQTHEPVTEEELKDIMKDAPPSTDEIIASVNDILHNLTEEEYDDN